MSFKLISTRSSQCSEYSRAPTFGGMLKATLLEDFLKGCLNLIHSGFLVGKSLQLIDSKVLGVNLSQLTAVASSDTVLEPSVSSKIA